jgi:ATP-dependent DNA helicase RecG
MDISDTVEILPYVGSSYAKKLERLGISRVIDLLYHIPRRYIDFSKHIDIAEASPGELVSIRGEVSYLKNQYTKSGKKIQIGEIKDSSGKITVVWFNQPFLTRTIYPGDVLSLAGKIEWFGRLKALISPEYEKAGTKLHTERLVPIYPLTSGISSKWLRGRIKKAIELYLPAINDPLSREIRKSASLLNLKQAILSVHYPKSLKNAEDGRKRLAFDELLSLQLAGQKRKNEWQKSNAAKILKIDNGGIKQFIKSFPFNLTASQKIAVREILKDLTLQKPMNRLLEGDVGSGKTVVAAIASFASFSNGYQTIIMAPTQILAEQHYHTFRRLFGRYKAKLALITSQKHISLQKDADIICGTHALLENKTILGRTALVIIDEQHKFGVSQRETLIKKAKGKSYAPHFLTMTATPIPRTVALTLYGEQDLSVLTDMPQGRIPPITWIVPPEKRESAYNWIKERINKDKTQVFVVCPLIEESTGETFSEVKAVKPEFEKLSAIFSNYNVSLLHGKIRKKDKIISDFRLRKTDILVTTPVVEVGIDIPNANIIVIEAADRFGLAQLHQLRGRTGRGNKKSYCLLFPGTTSVKSLERLNALKKEASGFKLAEIDLALRGPGEIFGTKQSGIPELKIARWTDIALIKKSREIAIKMAQSEKGNSY